MIVFIATFAASLLDPIAVVLCLLAGALIRRYILACVVGALIFVGLLAALSALPKAAAVLAGRVAAGAFLAAVGCFLAKKFLTKRQAS
ncbi:hypothetical protein QEM11_003465 [Pseudomonas putida]|uniref:hypothetical protein n=1 Tax=Pseudomonas putida TaxID=303 RepID=UPI002A0800A1|nr:hypothetical protein [Pseudomonas putida]